MWLPEMFLPWRSLRCMHAMVRVTVIGAGVTGLSTACNIQRLLPRAEVAIVAEKFSPHTTSDVAAGIWEPHCAGDTPQHLQRSWGDRTFHHLAELCRSEDAAECGVSLIYGYQLFEEVQPDPFWSSTVYGYRHLTEEELSHYPGHKHGFAMATYLCEDIYYLPYLMKRFKKNGGRVIEKKLNDINEVFSEADVVVNCAGIGARDLVKDAGIYPIRGQLLTVDAPWVKHFIISLLGDYQIFPGRDCVIMGGVHNEGDWNLEIDENDSKRIREGCTTLIPSLKNAELLSTRVGLRPARSSVRLELEWRKQGNKSIPVVHNYGHGGSGVTLHWGCALDAAELVKQAVTKQRGADAKLKQAVTKQRGTNAKL